MSLHRQFAALLSEASIPYRDPHDVPSVTELRTYEAAVRGARPLPTGITIEEVEIAGSAGVLAGGSTGRLRVRRWERSCGSAAADSSWGRIRAT